MSFDQIAPFYRTLETAAFGNVLQRARTRWLQEIRKPTRVLILGEGDGRFLCELLKLYPHLSIDCVDASARMLLLAKERAQRLLGESASRVRFFRKDISQWIPDGSYDLVVTHFFLDCFDARELSGVIEKIAKVAAPAATWLLADFTIPPGGPGELNARIWLRAMYAFFRMTAGLRTKGLVDPSGELRARGFSCQGREVSRFKMVKSEMWRRR